MLWRYIELWQIDGLSSVLIGLVLTFTSP
jgi:hypothetical protein